MMTKATRIFFWTTGTILGVVLLVLAILSAVIYSKRDEIKASLMEKANAHLVSHLEVKDITVSLFSHFPNITIVLSDITLDKTIPSDCAVISLEEIECVLDVPELIAGQISVRKLYLSDGYVDLHKDVSGHKDYDVIIPQKKNPNKARKPLHLDIHFIELKNVSFRLKDDYRPKDIFLTLKKVKIEHVHIDSNGAKATLHGQIFSQQLSFKGKAFLPAKALQCHLNILFDKNEKILTVDHSKITVNHHDLQVALLINFAHENWMKLNVRHDHAEPKAMFELIPIQYQQALGRFEFKGHLAFGVEVNTSLLPGRKPFVHVNFSSSDLGMNRVGKTNSLHDLHIKGALSVRPIDGKLVPSIVFHSIKGKINKLDITARALVKNFNDPWLDISVKSPIQLDHLRELFQVDNLQDAKGLIQFDMSYRGSYKYLTGQSTEIPHITGHIILDSAYVKLKKIAFPFTNLTGKITFQNQDAFIEDFYVKAGHSNLTLKAKMTHLFPALLSSNSSFSLEGVFHSSNLTMDDFASNDAPVLSEKEKEEAAKNNKKQVKKIFELYFPSNTFISLKGKINTFRNERLVIKNAELEFKMDNHKVEFHSSGNTLSGFIDTKISVDGKNLNAVRVSIQVKLKNIDVSQFLYSCNEFNQKLITSSILKGRITGKIGLAFTINKNIMVTKGSGTGRVDFKIKDGALINFEPLMKADNFLTKGRNLDSISFNDINSTLTLSKGEVLLNRTAIASSAGLLYVEGKTTTDWMSFLITLPIKTIMKKYQPKPHELSNDAQAGPSVLIRVEGPPNQLKVKIEKAQKN